jgi:hypothetical protein
MSKGYSWNDDWQEEMEVPAEISASIILHPPQMLLVHGRTSDWIQYSERDIGNLPKKLRHGRNFINYKTNQLTNLSPRSRVNLDKLIFSQLLKKCPAF